MKNYDDELCVVDVNGDFASIWSFCDSDNALQEVERATESAARTVATYESHIVNYPDRAEYWRLCKAGYENAKYEIMTFAQFLEHQKKAMLRGGVQEISSERFEEMLNVLPPLKWCTIDGVEMFCMSEMYTGTYTDQYARIGDKYYAARVDVTDRSTWIHERLKKSEI